jgi:hypothetical protein
MSEVMNIVGAHSCCMLFAIIIHVVFDTRRGCITKIGDICRKKHNLEITLSDLYFVLHPARIELGTKRFCVDSNSTHSYIRHCLDANSQIYVYREKDPCK